MTNEELETKKTELEMLILGLLNRFQAETRHRVTEFTVDYVELAEMGKFHIDHVMVGFHMEVEG